MIYTIADGEFKGVQVTLSPGPYKEMIFNTNGPRGNIEKIVFTVNHKQRILSQFRR